MRQGKRQFTAGSKERLDITLVINGAFILN